MKKLFGFILLLALAVPVMAQNPFGPPNKEIEFVPYFFGIGFAFRGGSTDQYHVSRLNILKTKETKLDQTVAYAEKNMKTQFVFAGQSYPVKIIKLDLENFEADIVKVKEESEKKGQIIIPIGHISLKLVKPSPKDPVMTGRLMIRLEDDPDKSGEYKLMLNDITPPPPKATEGGDADGGNSSGNASGTMENR
jgi:hypothetical protein